ncbi:hypothetical protein [Streptomyces brasiliensis]|uniref:Uncharacterized protein n=1 Tax=Streptomyces brasiliensis TaxID=1954 RepID=A0A917PF25_9ACTN|nr:hypothetical protein [Streptomyces brasiliensis]GGJ73877.1 hypothetical protein GCM10010121_100490 [Streptomyces brasiliensis]
MTAQASKTGPETAPSSAPVSIMRSHGPRAAAEHVVSGNSVAVRIGDLRLELPPRDQLAFLAGLGVLTALELIEWPVALAIGVGHELARSRHGKALREFGEALEEA